MVILFYVLAIFICLILPLALTILNIINLFKKKRIKENLVDILTFILGIPLTMLLYFISGFQDFDQSLSLGGGELGLHAPIASWSMPTVITICVIGIISFGLIRIKKLKLSPILVVTAMSGILICSIYMIIFIVQISNNIIEKYIFGLPYLIIFPINYILCSIRAEMDIIKRYKKENMKPKQYNNKLLNKCSRMLYNTDNWSIIMVILTIPITVILVSILVLFGQRPDEAIKAFLETSDWTLSSKISPPPIIYDGHYLCTVSLKGHRSLVKPIRMGIRKGEKIVVNRQLCIANAFEDLIHERFPKFHHFIRHIYDKYGYPISKHIKNAYEADIVYIIMKPLEWIFLIFLYLFDQKPENRIAIQYTNYTVTLNNKNFTKAIDKMGKSEYNRLQGD